MKKATLERQLRRLQAQHRDLETRFAEQVQFKIQWAKEIGRLRWCLRVRQELIGIFEMTARAAMRDNRSLRTENKRLRELLQQFKDAETDRAQRKIREMDQHEFFLRGMRRLGMSPEARRDSIRKEFAQEMGGTW